MSSSSLTFILFLTAAAQLACNKKTETAPPPAPRYAVLRFENLSGDPSLDWAGRAIGESLPVSIADGMNGPVLGSSALSRLATTFGSQRGEALAAGANRVITGYIQGTPGRIGITATEENLANGKSVRIVTATGTSLMAALDQLAHALSPWAMPPPTSNADALRAYVTALESSAPRPDLLAHAVQLDPGFGAAWVALASLHMARGDRAAAEEVLDHARGQKLDPLSQADLDLAAADLSGNRAASLTALRKVVVLSPADLMLRRSLATAETSAGEFKESAADWQKLIVALPNDPVAWNSLGYARSYAGDYAGALAALRQYALLRPKDANPPDSIGDLDYSFGKFKEAAASYLDAHAKQPGFRESGDLYKAAWAKFRAGDKAGADALVSQFRGERAKSSSSQGSSPQLAELLTGDWLYRTGRRREAMEAMRKLVAETQSVPLRTDALAQVTIWDLLQGDRAQAAKDAVEIGAKVNNASVFMARFAALPSAPVPEWETRAQRMFPPNAAALSRLALGYALLLDGKRQAAIPVWAQIVDTSPATEFFARAVYAQLQGKPLDRPLLPDPTNLNQFDAVLK